jgi:7,8-dihydropterin-6-yl-methyl-4-(beta-D-ribofuranosyl)aminobenzene 5'-phosphate synthase
MTNKITCVVNDVALENKGLKSEHGLSFWIETDAGTAMLDTGQTGEVLHNNLKALNLDVRDISALAISHGHNDHTGGLEALLAQTGGFTLFAHPDVFRPRFSLKNGEYRSIGMTLTKEALSGRIEMKLSSEPVEMIPGLWMSGEIRERSELEGSSARHFTKEGSDYKQDHYKDDISLILEVPGGLILICGCCHAGLLNTLAQVRRDFEKPVLAVFGGTHLLTLDGPSLRHVIAVLKDQFPQLHYFLNHCTGEYAIEEMKAVFGDRVTDFPAGSIIDLDSIIK